MTNRLANETSPYLRQHAGNPVDWWPWCSEALEQARLLDRPILLSIGYSACHWCHVMAHESFDDEEVAQTMNRLYINIKVDREERPDLDRIYQSAHQLLAQRSGGWPLTMFLTPDGTPFYGGTYFPKYPRPGLSGFVTVLEQVAAAYATNRHAIEDQNAAVRAALARTAASGSGTHPSDFGPGPLSALRDLLSSVFDRRFGGFGPAPKFPHPTDLEFLLHRLRTAGDEHAGGMTLETLAHMADGGVFDQLGGGFFRYSTDDRWQIPHFEKMLYDNGPLLGLYADAWQIDRAPRWRQVAERTAHWVMEEMQSPHGAYFTALDADSEGREGSFYVWDRDEVQSLLPPHALALSERHFGLDMPPNFENRHWHLSVTQPLGECANGLGIQPDDAASLIADARQRLLEARNRRIRPALDDKCLTACNGLMIAGMLRAARAFGRPAWSASALRALDDIRTRHWHADHLYATSSGGGKGRLDAYLDDHAFLLAALLEALQTRFRVDDLAFAEELADALLDHFEDRAHGGFFFTRHDHEPLIQRPKPAHDNATPSGNGVAARSLARLGHLTGETRYLQASERCLQAFYATLDRQPAGCAALALALAEHLAPPTLIVLRGPAAELDGWLGELSIHHRPDTMVLAIPPDTQPLPPVLDKPCDEHVRAWVCRGSTCLPPIATLAELEHALSC